MSQTSQFTADLVSPLELAVATRDADTLKMVSDALKHDQALLAFQPAVRADAPDKVTFHEGLIRVLDATGRTIPARDFMSVIENTELGREMDTASLRLGCSALSDVPNLRLALNMSARSIGYEPWLKTLEHWLQRDPTIGPRLILEITEGSAMLVPEIVVDFMERLQRQGICFALDNFGAGYTALRYFKDFFFDVMKLDGQFIRNVAEDVDNQVLIEAMATIGRQFDMLIVAEMVERKEDAEVLRRIGIDCLQGFLFGAPTTNPDWLPDTTTRVSRRV